MASRYKVTAGAVVLPTRAGSDTYMYRGTEFNAESFAPAAVAHALTVGLITAVDAAPTAPAEAEADGASTKAGRRTAK